MGKVTHAEKTDDALLQAQGRLYVEGQKKADSLGRVANYLFWVATSTMAATAIGAYNIFAVGAATIAPWILAITAVASVGSLVASMAFSRNARAVASESNLLYSRHNAQVNGKGVVQELAKAQHQAQQHNLTIDENPTTALDGGPRWAERTQSQQQNKQRSWTEYVAERAQAENVQQLASLQGGR